MYTYEEAQKDLQEKIDEEGGEDERNEHHNHVIKKLPSFRPQMMKKAISRAPSFFQKMFSSRKLNRIGIDEDDEDEQEEEETENKVEEKQDEHIEGRTVREEDKEQQGNEKERNDSDTSHLKSVHDWGDSAQNVPAAGAELSLSEGPSSSMILEGPPIPQTGKPIKIEKLINRNRKAELGLNTLMEMVNRDVAVSLFDAKHIPVADGYDRVNVTPEISSYMNKIRSQKQIDRHVHQNMNNIQKSLNYRKSSIIIMNANYSQQLVRKIEPIYHQEARTTVIFK